MAGVNSVVSTSRLLMQYARWLPYKLGLINRAAFLLQIKEILLDDVFLVSYPKSGNTWLRYIVAYLITKRSDDITLDELELIVPDVYVSKDTIDKQAGHRFIKSHHAFYSDYPRTIYIYRDYRDVLVSFYHYQTSLKLFDGDFIQFLKSNQLAMPFGSWKEHVSAALKLHEEHPQRILLLSYEALLNNFENEVIRIASFIGADNTQCIHQLKQKTNFKNLRKTENNNGGWYNRLSKQHFFREGKAGHWKQIISPQELEIIYSDSDTVQLLQKLGYEL